jgi:predicted hydrocarbon binding protein
MAGSPTIALNAFDPRVMRRIWEAQSFTKQTGQQALRTEVGDFVNIFWMNLVLWSSMMWDPKRVPAMLYEFDKDMHFKSVETMSQAPWRIRLFMKLFMPKSFSEVKDMKKFASYIMKSAEGMGMGIWEYMEEASRKDEHYFRVYESSFCWPFADVGVRLGFNGLGSLAGMLKAFGDKEQNWSLIETKCVGKGDPYCELKGVPEETAELKEFLEDIDSSVLEDIHMSLINRLTEFVVHGEPLPERPRLGSHVSFNQMFLIASLPSLVSERYRMAVRMGGARAGREIGERLINAGLEQDEVVKRVIDFMEYCRVGKVELGDTIRIKENCEVFGLEIGEPSCFFTTGFLNGLFSSVKSRRVREIKCCAAGDPYCEWEII